MPAAQAHSAFLTNANFDLLHNQLQMPKRDEARSSRALTARSVNPSLRGRCFFRFVGVFEMSCISIPECTQL
jgi:hypothetical protein